MAVQQRRVSQSRKGMRRSHDHLVQPNLGVCQSCGKAKPMHRVCSACGTYKNKKILDI